MHHTRHESGHTHQREINYRNIDAHQLEQVSAQKARQGTHEQRGSKYSAYTATAVGRDRGYDLEQQHE